MENYTLVRPEHLNHHGFLFGGQMLKWTDEFAWLTASLDFPGCRLTTIAMNDIVFKHSAAVGAILRFDIMPERQGNTSITYRVVVFADEPGASDEKEIFQTSVTFVRIGDDGVKAALPRRERLRSQTSKFSVGG